MESYLPRLNDIMKVFKKNLELINTVFGFDEEFNKRQKELIRIGPDYTKLQIPKHLNRNRWEAIYMSPAEFRDYV